MNVLVIDDQAPLAEMIGEAFRDEGYGVDLAFNGREGLERIADAHHGLIVTDMLMPDHDGLEIIRNARRLDPDAKVIAVSGGGLLRAEIHLHTAERLGADAILTKPFRPSALVQLGAELLAN